MKIITHKDQGFLQAVTRVCQRAAQQNTKVEKAVRTILDAVRREGDQALQRLTWKFDHVRIRPDYLRVTSKDVEAAYAELPSSDIKALKYA
ncbi:MAG: histidinol dehydrogenase, partial [Nitrospira sp.]|nr:histidinol dehydrogenase [Nitrospira sp.]